MICDALATFCDNTALNTGAAGTYIIGDVIDLGATSGGLRDDQNIYIVATVDTTATSGGSATLALDLVTDDNSSISSGTVIASISPATAVASITQGTVLGVIALPLRPTVERYIAVRQTTGTAAFTAGKVNVFMTLTPPTWAPIPDALSKI